MYIKEEHGKFSSTFMKMTLYEYKSDDHVVVLGKGMVRE